MKTLQESIIGRKGSGSTWLIFVPMNNDNKYFVNEFRVDENQKFGGVKHVRAKNHWNVWISTPPIAARKNISLNNSYSLIYMTHLPLERVINICKNVKWTFSSTGVPDVPDEFEEITHPDYLNMVEKYK